MSEKSEVQNLDGQNEATEPLDASPDAEDAGQVAQGEPKDYGRGGDALDERQDRGDEVDR